MKSNKHLSSLRQQLTKRMSRKGKSQLYICAIVNIILARLQGLMFIAENAELI